MRFARRLATLVRNMCRRNRVEQELDDEVRSYLDQLTEDRIAAGVTPAEARRAAHLELGGVEQVKQQVRDARSGRFLDTLWRDICFGARQLRRNPGFTAVAVLTLTLGIGANTAIFSMVNAVLLEPFPFPEPDRLVMIWNQYGSNRTSNSPPDYFDRLEQSRLLESIAAFRLTNLNLTGQGDPVQLQGGRVTASFFTTLGVAPLTGRPFRADEDVPGRDDVVVLSHGAWLRRWGGDPRAIGSKILLDDRSSTIIGVMPASFSLLFPNVEVWAPIAFPPEAKANANRGDENLSVVARIKRGISLAQVRDEMAAIATRAIDTVPSRRDFLINAKWSAAVVPLREQYAGVVRPLVVMLFGAVLLVMLIACANVASLLLARHVGRARELAIRAALGASRGRIVGQLLVENLLLSATGGLLGAFLAGWGTHFLSSLGLGFSPLLAQARLNASVLFFALGLVFSSALLFGLAPALRLSRPDLHDDLQEGGRTIGAAMSLVSHKALVVSEVALALVLLVAAGLLIRSFQRLWEVSPGFEAADRLTFILSLPETRYAEAYRRIAFHQEILARLRALPGVLDAGTVQSLPIAGTVDTATVHIEGYVPPPGSPSLGCEYRMISPGYLRAMGIPLMRGRDFNEADSVDSLQVVLVDERAAQRFWPGEDPIGKRLGFSLGKWREVIGVVGHVRNRSLDVSGQEQVYLPYQQSPQFRSYFVLHTQGPIADVLAATHDQLRNVDASLPLFDAHMMDELLAASLSKRRLSMSLLAGFAGVALVLAAIGIYGVIAYSVRQRTREIGVRMALGAQRDEIFRLVVGQGMNPALTGLVLGLAGAAAVTRLLERLLFGVRPHDLVAFVVAALLVVVTALLACYMPARRATRVDPMVALRYE